jgi:hypothetical protein
MVIIEEAMKDHSMKTRRQQGPSHEYKVEATSENDKGSRLVCFLICCMRILGSQLFYRFSEPRAKFLSLLLKILEKAED